MNAIQALAPTARIVQAVAGLALGSDSIAPHSVIAAGGVEAAAERVACAAAVDIGFAVMMVEIVAGERRTAGTRPDADDGRPALLVVDATAYDGSVAHARTIAGLATIVGEGWVAGDEQAMLVVAGDGFGDAAVIARIIGEVLSRHDREVAA